MRTLFIYAFFTLFALISGCTKSGHPVSFYVKDQTSIQIRSSVLVNIPFEVTTPEMSSNSSQEFENNNTNAALVKDVKLNELKLTITGPEGKTFSFLKSIHIYISTSENADDEVELAFLDNIPADSAVISLNVSDNKLDEYIKSSKYTLRTEVQTRETLTEDIDIQADIKFFVTADLF